MEPDFSGYATKAGLKCSDGRVITPAAFQHMHGKKVPLVWQHGHNAAENILGHALLEHRKDGVYAYGFFNETPHGQHSKMMVQHGDIDSLSIFANSLRESNRVVEHGNIRELSLVISGANPEAKIDYVRIMHSSDPNDFTILDDEAVIRHMGSELFVLSHDDEDDEVDEDVEDDETEEGADETVEHADKPMTVKDIYDQMDEDEKNVLHLLVDTAVEKAKADSSAQHSDSEEGAIAHEEGTEMTKRNVFEGHAGGDSQTVDNSLSHDEMKGFLASAIKTGSFKEAAEAYALAHGIDSIETLFPDAKNMTATPEFNKRRTEWVQSVLNGTRHTPFSRVKSIVADLTQEDARAKGYVKGTYKKEEWFGVQKRSTTPTTIYKKQKLDRDDILDITDFDVVTWLWGEMRLMLEEELARAILIGDGRDVGHEDKIKDPIGAAEGAGIRSIVNDHELYVTTLNVNVLDANSNYEEVVDAVLDGMEFYKGTGTPTFYTTIKHLNSFLKAKDLEGRRYYRTKQEVAEALGVANIVTVEPMNDTPDLIGIIVNLDDYNIGADKGGEIARFDDFDIDYNQFKYLLETRLSGALTKIKSAIVIKRTALSSVLAEPVKPSFVASTGVITIPNVTGVKYRLTPGGSNLTAGAQTAIAAGATQKVYAVPDTGYHFSDNQDDDYTFKRNPA